MPGVEDLHRTALEGAKEDLLSAAKAAGPRKRGGGRLLDHRLRRFIEAMAGQPADRVIPDKAGWATLRKAALSGAKGGANAEMLADLVTATAEKTSGTVFQTPARGLMARGIEKAKAAMGGVAPAAKSWGGRLLRSPTALGLGGVMAAGALSNYMMEPSRQRKKIQAILGEGDVVRPSVEGKLEWFGLIRKLMKSDPEMARLLMTRMQGGGQEALPLGTVEFGGGAVGPGAGMLSPEVAAMMRG